MTKIDKTDIENIKLILSETNLINPSTIKIKKGDYEILCAEYCGTGHYAMRGRVLVDEEKDYSNWLAKQISFEKMLAKNNLEKNLLIAENKN